ncbi:unnamed protein product [Adineta steineri]|uniref:Centrosomal protein kizuna n=1 Tax=Adineta steineri TaxID=433720 RepID=A0A815GTR2_9BILA|nr:unnamed protein product [Adineta steineri]CAF1593779.1 unnamed protein product [Adineta steineri]
MNSSSMTSALADYHKKRVQLRSKILKSEEERIQLEQKLQSLSSIDSRLKQREQVDHIQSYFTQLNQESQRAEQRNLQLLNDITQAERNLIQLRMDAEHLIRLKSDYSQHLETNYPNWEKSVSNEANKTTKNNIYDFSRFPQQQNISSIHSAHEADSSILFKRHEDHLKVDIDHRNSQHDEQSLSESTSNTFSRSKRTGSLRMELNRSGLYFLLDFIEKELIDTIDKKKFYHHDPPTITQKRTILDIANEQKQFALKDLDPTTTSMVILDQLPSTIRRTTVNQCLLTEDILSSNIIDLDKDVITKMLPEQDRSLWTRLIDHFTRLLKFHIMNSQTLANKFAPILLPNNVFYLHDKAKDLIKHIVEKLVGTQQSSSEDEITDRKQSLENIIKTTTAASSSSWLDKLTSGKGIDDNDDTSSASTTTPKKNIKSANSTPRGNIYQDDSDLDFYS